MAWRRMQQGYASGMQWASWQIGGEVHFMAKLICPQCRRPIDFKRAQIERAADDGVEIVTCAECGERFYTERLPLNFTGMWLALLAVSLLAAWLAPRPLCEVALVALGVLVLVPAARMLAWGFGS